ncbi:MAG: iron-containing alcohol dehydrogenase [Mycoplasmataceae bacterium]|nr:iron-containing alcohol dehydrogenase [Mycoplasmataceae bacterium]
MTTKLKIIPTYYFGKDVVNHHLANELKHHHIKKVLLTYGGGSIKRNNLYNEILAAAKKAKVQVIEHGGIEPNPRDIGIEQAALKCRKNKVNLIIAAGGGSVIDASKIIGILANNPQYKSAWEYILDNSKVTKPSIPLFSITTLAATGSENNAGSVITNSKTHYKQSASTPSATPIVCFEDPKYTMTLSFWQMSCGIFDIFSHLLEQFYDPIMTFDWTKEYILANMRECYKSALKFVKNNNDYDAHSNLLWTSSWSLNGLASFNTTGGDWTTHRLEHAVSGLWDVEHGAGLALITPVYLDVMCKHSKLFRDRSLEVAQNVFGVNTLSAFFIKLKTFIKLLKLPVKFTDFKQIKKVSDQDIAWLVKHFAKNNKSKNSAKLANTIFNKLRK